MYFTFVSMTYQNEKQFVFYHWQTAGFSRFVPAKPLFALNVYLLINSSNATLKSALNNSNSEEDSPVRLQNCDSFHIILLYFKMIFYARY